MTQQSSNEAMMKVAVVGSKTGKKIFQVSCWVKVWGTEATISDIKSDTLLHLGLGLTA